MATPEDDCHATAKGTEPSQADPQPSQYTRRGGRPMRRPCGLLRAADDSSDFPEGRQTVWKLALGNCEHLVRLERYLYLNVLNGTAQAKLVDSSPGWSQVGQIQTRGRGYRLEFPSCPGLTVPELDLQGLLQPGKRLTILQGAHPQLNRVLLPFQGRLKRPADHEAEAVMVDPFVRQHDSRDGEQHGQHEDGPENIADVCRGMAQPLPAAAGARGLA